MNNDRTVTTSRSLSVLNFLFGVWLIISPYILGYVTAQARWEQTIAGIIVAILAAVHYFMPAARWTSWVNLVVGIWMIIAPFATGYQVTAAFWNEIVFGILIAAAAVWNGSVSFSRLHPSNM